MKYLPVSHYKTNPEIDSDQPIAAIYFLRKRKRVIYIGRTTNIKQRIIAHKSISRPMFFDDFRFIKCSAEKQVEYEKRIIRIFKPKMNLCQYKKEGRNVFIERIL